MKKIFATLLALLIANTQLSAMHIAEGFLPAKWSILWWIAFIPFLLFGFNKLKKVINEVPQAKILYAVVGAFVFVLSSLKLPSLAGSSSHLTGIAMGALLFGASSMSIIGIIVLLFQALLLAHGGITTLGANAFSMAVVGAFVAVGIYKAAASLKAPQWLSIFLAAFFSDLCIYMCTSVQLAMAFQSEANTIMDNTLKFLSVFALSQLPLAIIEGILTVLFYQLITRYNSEEIKLLSKLN